MKLLLLNGHGMNIWVDSAKLHVKDGRYTTTEEPQTYIFAPKRIDVENIVIYGQDGNLSIDAIRWVVKHNVQITILNWDGKLLTTILPPESPQSKTRFSQYAAFNDQKRRLALAKAFLAAKFERTQAVLDWLKDRYPVVENDFTTENKRWAAAKTIPELMMVEGRIASFYWRQIAKIVPESLEFETREYQKRPWGAGDTVNCLLNYGYAILEAEALRGINAAGLDPHVGFLHEMNPSKKSLAYDFQEPYRFLVDLAVIGLIEQKAFDKRDFIRSETYTLRLQPTGARKLIAAIEEQFAARVPYKGQTWSWRKIMQDQIQEMAMHLNGKRSTIDFCVPRAVLQRQDNEVLRQQILALSYVEWEKMGFSRGTLHYLKQNARSDKPFTVNKHVQERLEDLRTTGLPKLKISKERVKD